MNAKGFIKIELGLFDTTEFIVLDSEEGATGIGCMLKIFKYLRRCNNATGSLAALPAVARDCHKSKKYVEHIIRDFGLFHLTDDGLFYSDYLNSTLNHQKPSESKKNNTQKATKPANQTVEKTSEKTDENSTKVEQNSKKVQLCTTQLADNQHPSLYIEDSKIEDSKIEDRKETSTTQRKSDDADEDLKRLIKLTFNDATYMPALQHLSGLDININPEIRFYAMRWFYHRCITQNKHPADLTDAKQYLMNLLRKGRKTRDEFMAYLNEVRRKKWEAHG